MPSDTPETATQARTKPEPDTTGHSDIHLAGLWAKLPVSVHPYITLARLDRPIGWWLLVLPGWWIFAAFSPSISDAVWHMALFTIGAVVMRGAGCIINDLWDRHIDARIERTRTRPLASGQISVFAALCFLGGLSCLGLMVLIQLPVVSWAVGLAALPLVVLYPLAKRITDWPQIVLGLTFSWAIPVAGAVLWQGWPPAALWLIYAGSVCWVVGYDTVYAVQDMQDDRKTGVRSSALALGRHIKSGVSLFYLMAVLLWTAGLFSLMAPGAWLAGMGLVGGHFIWQLKSLDVTEPASALRIFKSNRDAGLLLTAGLLFSTPA